LQQRTSVAFSPRNNWERIDPRRPLVPSNLRLLRRFTGLVAKRKTTCEADAQGESLEKYGKMPGKMWENMGTIWENA
jgi:hypothetical protein